MTSKAAAAATVRVESVPGLLFDAREASPEEAAELVASGSFQYADQPADEPAVTAATDEEATDGNAG